MKDKALLFILFLILVTASSETTFAQERPYCNLRFRGKPYSECCSYFIFESAMYGKAIRSGAPAFKEGFLFTFDFGVMFNNQNSSAFGGSLHVTTDDNGTFVGVGPRYRRWLSNNIGLDISPVLMMGGTDNEVHRRFPGFGLAASLSLGELISFNSYLQIIRYEQTVWDYSDFYNPTSNTNRATERGLYFGLSGRSYLAPVIPVAMLVIVAATFDLNWNN